MTMSVVTHMSPDFDAVGSIWVAERAGLIARGNYVVTFVSAGQTDPKADYVFDTGGEYDPERGRFDHHGDKNLPSATYLVWRTLNDDAIKPLIDIINDCDLGVRNDITITSRTVGLHALFSAFARTGLPKDQVLLDYGLSLLDLLGDRLQEQALIAETFSDYIECKGDRVVAIANGSRGHTGYAFDKGYDLVLFYNETDVTTSVGMSRRSETPIMCNDLVDALLLQPDLPPALRLELMRWYRHPSGFFAGRGTAKNPDNTPFDVQLLHELTRRIDLLLAQP